MPPRKADRPKKRNTPVRPVNAQRPGRPSVNTTKGETLYTPALQEQIVGLIRAGNYSAQAAAACGIATSTYYEWLKRGARGEHPFTDLAEAVKRAEAEAEARGVAVIAKASTTQWQAAAWFLERKHFKRWGRKDSLELTGDDTKPIQIRAARADMGKLSEEERNLLMALREKMRVIDAPAVVDADEDA